MRACPGCRGLRKMLLVSLIAAGERPQPFCAGGLPHRPGGRAHASLFPCTRGTFNKYMYK